MGVGDRKKIGKNIWEGKILAKCSLWDWHDSKRIDVLDNKGKRLFSLDEWETFVFYAADGNNTLNDILKLFPTLYKNKDMIPKGYEKKILSAAEVLFLKKNLVELWDRKENLPHQFELPTKEKPLSSK